MAIPRGMGMAKGKELKEKYGAKLENWNFQRGDWGGGGGWCKPKKRLVIVNGGNWL